ncbi:MAG TPA: FtsQ-type POTRA domain-containing protein [Jatrophihabitantaceae bacterium]|nr:FtsQ-type POTRA domain-containing protein [Jatrophihabitantaceae bacterium]
MTTTAASTPTVESHDDGSGGGIPHRKLILGTIAVVLVGAVATWLVAFSSVFGVHTVDVRGVHVLTADQVRSAAKIANGTPLVRLDTDGIRSRVEALPDVASAKVTTSFPSTVIITISERTAIGVVKGGSGYLLVDRTGEQFRTVAARPAGLPLFVVPQGAAGRPTGSAVATVAGALNARLRGRIDSIQAISPQAITLLFSNGRVVRWGNADRSAAKARILPILLHRPGTQIDVTDPSQPFTR